MGLLALFGQTTYTYTTVETTNSTGSAIFSGVYLLIWLAIIVIAIIAYWKIFVKAGEAGWKSIIPIYNLYVLLKIVGRPGWWLLLYLIPFVNIVISIIVALDLAKVFGRSGVFGFFGLWLFSLIGYLILAFGSDTYKGTGGGAKSTPAAATPPPAAPAPQV